MYVSLQATLPVKVEKNKKRKVYAVERHIGRTQTWEQPGLAALGQQAKWITLDYSP